jgi:hypothetical protein
MTSTTQVTTEVTLTEVVGLVVRAHYSERAIVEAVEASKTPIADACLAVMQAIKQGMSLRDIENHPDNKDKDGKTIVGKDTINRYVAIGKMLERVGSDKVDAEGISIADIKFNLDNGMGIKELNQVNKVSQLKAVSSKNHPAVKAKRDKRKANNLPKDSKADKIANAIESGKWTRADLDKIALALNIALDNLIKSGK